MNIHSLNTSLTISTALPKIRWVIVAALLLALLVAPEFAYACGSSSGNCGG